jgi:hypothetical protein
MLLAVGCTSDVANRYYAGEKYAPKPIDQVEVLYKEPSRPYVVIADFQSRGEDAEDMRKKAADIGADAVIVTYLGGTYGNNEKWSKESSMWTKDRYSRISGTAIRYTDKGAMR